MNPGVYTREPTVAQLVTGLMDDAQKLLRQEVALMSNASIRNVNLSLYRSGRIFTKMLAH